MANVWDGSSATGPSGRLRRGYVVVAELPNWHWYKRGPIGAWKLGDPWGAESYATERNAFWLDGGGPFTLELELPDGRVLRG